MWAVVVLHVESVYMNLCLRLVIYKHSVIEQKKKMFPVSTQKKYWTFVDETDLIRLRQEANRKFILKHGANMTVCVHTVLNFVIF